MTRQSGVLGAADPEGRDRYAEALGLCDEVRKVGDEAGSC